MSLNEEALELHRAHAGKLAVTPKVQISNDRDLALAYTPGVAEPCREIAANPDKVYEYTFKGNMVAIITDGTRVLGLGDIGPFAGLPVMEGKAALFKTFAGVDAFPLCLNTKDPEEFIRTVMAVAPVFGGINLEDIATPKCYAIEERLRHELDIPVFHDDQHGTAVAVSAAVLNALRLVGKPAGGVRIVVNGAGAAGTAIVRLLLEMKLGEVLVCDRPGILREDTPGLNEMQRQVAHRANPAGRTGSLDEAAKDADVLIGASSAGAFEPDLIRQMAEDPIVLALANPDPEISYADARAAGARVAGTGRSDAPNQVNNVLVFPGLFRGALDARAREINEAMKVAAAKAVADVVRGELAEDRIVPKPFDHRVAPAVAEAVAEAAVRTGVARVAVDPAEVAERTRRLAGI